MMAGEHQTRSDPMRSRSSLLASFCLLAAAALLSSCAGSPKTVRARVVDEDAPAETPVYAVDPMLVSKAPPPPRVAETPPPPAPDPLPA
ncbi:MAG: hypothetical protein D6696_08555 [Acidobacteria bacterium]|nr:MAG: hypothetical protein D6696_08555 [Acidobacteriota bacterium]